MTVFSLDPRRRGASVSALILVLAVLAWVAGRSEPRGVAARPLDQQPIPFSLAAALDGDLYVSMWTDTLSGIVQRRGTDGALKANTTSSQLGTPVYIAESPSGLYGAGDDWGSGEIYRFAEDIGQIERFAAPGAGRIAVLPGGNAVVLAQECSGVSPRRCGSKFVRIYSLDPPALVMAWIVDSSAGEIAVGPAAGGGSLIYVAEGTSAAGRLVAYTPSGVVADVLALPGIVGGLDVDTSGRIVAGVSSTRELNRQLGSLVSQDVDGRFVWLADILGVPSSVTIAPDGDVFVAITAWSGPRENHLGDVVRYTRSGCLRSVWTVPFLHQLITPTPAPAAPCGGGAEPTGTPWFNPTPWPPLSALLPFSLHHR